jgi:hypothetical protein
MTGPIAAENLLLAFASSALILIFAGLYTLLFAWARVWRKRQLLLPAYLSYLFLIGAAGCLVKGANLRGEWLALVGLLLIGYLLAPHLIWSLSVATDAESDLPPSTHEERRHD